jgi:hypothetical protein
MRPLTTIGVVGALALTGAGVAAAPAARTSCTPGPFTANGSSGVVFCGPAKAVAKVGRAIYTFSSGSCTRTSKYVNINIGTEVLTGPKRAYSYFGLLVGAYPGASPGTKAAPNDGTYTGGLVTVRWKGKDYALNGAGDKNVKITLKNGRASGSFSGNSILAPHVRVTGTFSCK